MNRTVEAVHLRILNGPDGPAKRWLRKYLADRDRSVLEQKTMTLPSQKEVEPIESPGPRRFDPENDPELQDEDERWERG